MADNVVEDVRLLQAIEFGFRADEGPGRNPLPHTR